jgi:hypothetical protein
MTPKRRVELAMPIFAWTVVLAIGILSPVMLAAARQDVTTAPVEVGSGPIRERALGLTGRNVYGLETVEIFGFLTSVIGLDPALLFTEAPPSERTARFTYAGSVPITSRANRGDITTLVGEGVFQVFLDDAGGASWDNPASFRDGQPVAEWSIRLRETLHRQAPDVGVLVGDGELVQATAGDFALEGEQYRFGNEGIEQRLQYVGALLSGAAEPPSFAISLTGTASVVVREAIPVNVGQVVAGAATPAAEACRGLQPWLDQTMDNLARGLVLVAAAGPGLDLTSLDEEVVSGSADEMAALTEAQRGLEAPESAAEVDRLFITGLSTSARGLEVIATAVAQQDTGLLTQGQSVVADGSQLLERAENEVAALAGTCAES